MVLSEKKSDLHRIQNGAKFSQQSLPHVVTAACVSQDQHWSPATATARCQLQKHTRNTQLLETAPGPHPDPQPEPSVSHLAVLLGLPATQLVDLVQVVRRDDEAVELSQLTLVCIRQAVHAVIVHRVLTPHTPRGRRTQSHQKRQEITQKSCGGSRTLNVSQLQRCRSVPDLIRISSHLSDKTRLSMDVPCNHREVH